MGFLHVGTFPVRGLSVESLNSIGFGKTRTAKKIGTAVGRAVPHRGYAQVIVILALVARETRNQYNLIARPKDKIAWTYF